MDFTGYAKGALILGNVKTLPVEALKGIDFLVVECGWGADYYEKCAEWLNVAAAANIPAFFRIKMDMIPYLSIGYNPDKFPIPEKDVHMITLDRALFSGGLAGLRRSVYGVIWDATQYKTLDGKTIFTETWMAGLLEHLAGMSWTRHHTPYWYHCAQSVLNAYGNNSASPLATLFTGQPMCSFKYGLGDNTAVALDDCTGFAYPDEYIKVYVDGQWKTVENKPDYIYGSSPFIWEYTINKYTVKGITDGANLVPVHALLYWGTKDKLYKEIGFTPKATPTPVDPNPTDPNPTNPNPTDPNPTNPTPTTSVDLSGVIAQLKRIADALEGEKEITISISKKA